MTQSTYDHIAESHNLASHVPSVATVAHGKGNYLTAHELSVQALEYSKDAYRHSEQSTSESRILNRVCGESQVQSIAQAWLQLGASKVEGIC